MSHFHSNHHTHLGELFFFFNFKFPDVFLGTLATHAGSVSCKYAFYQVLMPNTGQEMISTLFSSLIGR